MLWGCSVVKVGDGRWASPRDASWDFSVVLVDKGGSSDFPERLLPLTADMFGFDFDRLLDGFIMSRGPSSKANSSFVFVSVTLNPYVK